VATFLLTTWVYLSVVVNIIAMAMGLTASVIACVMFITSGVLPVYSLTLCLLSALMIGFATINIQYYLRIYHENVRF
jgi:hypothetical protein